VTGRDVNETVAWLAALPTAIGESLDKFGGYLRCETCHIGHTMKRGEAGYYTAHGWPKCCGLTMRWWTQRQIESGEMS
jgi:hypothetical protein